MPSRRMAYYPVTLRDPAALATAVEGSGMSRQRIAATTLGLRQWKPDRYDSVSDQTISNLINGATLGTTIKKAQALEEALRVPGGTFFAPSLQNERFSVAERLSCSRDHIYDLIDAGELRGINIGIRASKLRLHPEDVENYIERHTTRAGIRAVS